MQSGVWQIRMQTMYSLLNQSYAVVLTDLDSIWNWYVDLDKLPPNFDVFHSVCTKNPPKIKFIWGFTLCAGLAFYRPTANTLRFWKMYYDECKVNCDDQFTLNSLYRGHNVTWANVDQTYQEALHYSPIGYKKIGALAGISYKLIWYSRFRLYGPKFIWTTGYMDHYTFHKNYQLACKIWG